ncbi:retrotransposon protein, putative, ty1-copia subclass [Tanacetum coccineum]|uniref:Retrotransposon protein, putative, ty1-copia subclass n=1 Tax=Tanacetum coccineum TaxID=301880 RepID=A0ABQ5G733_9ASTR
MKSYLEQLERLSYVLPQDISVGLILNGLTNEFVGFVRNYNIHNMGKTIGDLHALFIKYEKSLPKKAATPQVLAIQGGLIQKPNKKPQATKGKGKGKGNGKSKLAYVPKPKNASPAKKEHPTKDATFHHYKEVGHWRRNYLVYLAELLMKKKKQVSSANTSAIKEPSITWTLLIYRLAHISKKRIEKLQHDGLLKSMDDESFDQCVSCLSGKMTRKPFPHQTERVTDLLGLIYTDVCDLVIHVSRQGASYFITFTDDFSRYGYVYLVFETFKDYALESATRLLNMVPTKKVDKTPYELWYEKVPILSYLKVWRCKALVKRDTPNTLQQRSIKCIFVGYPKETMGYYFYYPPENKIVVARYAEFFEKNLISQEASGRAVELEEIQDEDTSPSKNTSEHLVEAKTIKPQEDVTLIRTSVRTHRAPERLRLNVEVEEHSLGDLNEPTNYKAALLDHESNK